MNYSFHDFLTDFIVASKNIRITDVNNVPDTNKIVENISRLQSYLYDIKERYTGTEESRMRKIGHHYQKAVDCFQLQINGKISDRHEVPFYLVSNYNAAVKDLQHWQEIERKFIAQISKRTCLKRTFLVAQNGEIIMISEGGRSDLQFENNYCNT